MMPKHTVWDIFCKVVDHFGDIGVCWRLARQLAQTDGLHIQLWVDEFALAQRFMGAGHPLVSLRHWTPDADFGQSAVVVIETFACGLPEAYQQAMLKQPNPPIWIHLEYLSAEAWVEGVHGLPSPQANGLMRHFFYPGFTTRTGGLLREAHLSNLHSQVKQQASAFWQRLGVPTMPAAITVSLFCYAHAPLVSLMQCLSASIQPVRLLVPITVAPMLRVALAWSELNVGDVRQCGACEICVLPLLTQDDYDRLLFCCDLNFVRGEDSWIRAIWAGKPLIWLPYLQTEDSHLDKLEAFLSHYVQGLAAEPAATVRAGMLAWAQGTWQDSHWQAWCQALPVLYLHAQQFAHRLSQQTDLTTNLVICIENLSANRV